MFASVAFALLASAAATAPLHRGNGEIIEGEYVVVFHKDSVQAARDAHMTMMEVCVHKMRAFVQCMCGYARAFHNYAFLKHAADDWGLSRERDV